MRRSGTNEAEVLETGYRRKRHTTEEKDILQEKKTYYWRKKHNAGGKYIIQKRIQDTEENTP